jgi:hypothetical protein
MLTRSRRAHAVSSSRSFAAVLWAASLVTTMAVSAWAGQPATLSDNDGGGAKPSPADSARKATASKTAKAPAKATTAPSSSKAPATAQKPATATQTKTAAKTPSATAKTAPTAGRVAPAGAKPTTTNTSSSAAKAPAATRTTPAVARVAPSTVQSGAKTASPPTVVKGPPTATRPSSGSGSVAKLPAPTKVAPVAKTTATVGGARPSNAKTAGLTPTVNKVAPAPARSAAPTLATKGGTTVQSPTSQASPGRPSAIAKITPIKPSGVAKVGVAGGVGAASVAKGPAKGTGAKASSPSKSVASTVAPVEDQVTYQYNALGRRDPFQSLMEGEYVGADVGGQAPPDLGGLRVVGVVWGTTDQFAMVEDVRGDSYVLRRGDRVMNGYVEGLKRDAMIVNITVDGQSQTVSIPVTRKGDKSNGNR